MDFSKIPILKDIDFSDPAKRKSILLVAASGAMLVLLLIVMLVTSGPKGEDPPQEAENSYVAPEIPEGEDLDKLDGKNLRGVLAQSSKTAEDLFSDDIVDDPLKDILEGEDRIPQEVPPAITFGSQDVFPERRTENDDRRQEAVETPQPYQYPGQTAEDREKAERDARIRRRMIENGIDPDTGYPIQRATPPTYTDPSALPPPQPTYNDPSALTPQQGTPQQTEEPQEEAPIHKTTIRKSGRVTSLASGGSSAATTISSLGDSDPYVTDDPTHPFRVKFAYDEKLVSGQRVTLRLCEDMVVDGVLIPANTHLFGTCTIGQRLEIKVSSININGKIFTLSYEAYDNDGASGLYCPVSSSSKSSKQAAEDAGQIVSSAIQSAVSGYVGRMVSSGASLIRSKSGEEKVEVTAGYQFYLMEAKSH